MESNDRPSLLSLPPHLIHFNMSPFEHTHNSFWAYECFCAVLGVCVCVWVFFEHMRGALRKGAHCAYGAHGREVCDSSGQETLISRVKRQKKVLLLCFGRTEALHTQPKAAEKPIIRNWRRQRHGNWAIFFCALIFFPLLQQLCLSLFLYASVLWQNKRAL